MEKLTLDQSIGDDSVCPYAFSDLPNFLCLVGTDSALLQGRYRKRWQVHLLPRFSRLGGSKS